VQRQAHDIDVIDVYPHEFYEKTWEHINAKDISHSMDLIKNRLGTEAQFEGFNFTTPVSDINIGNHQSSYTQSKTMLKKLQNQLELAEKIEAVDAKKVALKVLTTHFFRDIAGNLRAFSTQSFRCKTCNKRFRRLPLFGRCSICGKSITLTVYRGGIEKYIEIAHTIIEKYDLPQYYAQRLFLIKEEIYSLFENTKSRQIKLINFV
jgi:DNA polymerase II large subunit